jgi:hypothetical protein
MLYISLKFILETFHERFKLVKTKSREFFFEVLLKTLVIFKQVIAFALHSLQDAFSQIPILISNFLPLFLGLNIQPKKLEVKVSLQTYL